MKNRAKFKNKVALILSLYLGYTVSVDAALSPVIENTTHISTDAEIEVTNATTNNDAGINLNGLKQVTLDSGKKVEIVINGAAVNLYGDELYGIYAQNGATVVLDKVIIREKDNLSKMNFGLKAERIGSKIVVGDDLMIVTKEGSGISANDGGQVEVGKNAQLSGGMFAYAAGSKITIGDGLKINDPGSMLIYSGSGAEVVIGKNAELIGGVFGSGSGAVTVGYGGKVTIGDHALIVNDGSDQTYKYHHFGIISFGTGSILEVGSDSKIATKGTEQNLGVVAGVWVYDQSGIIKLGDRTTIDTTEGGDISYGMWSTIRDSLITLGNESQILTSGVYSHGAVASKGGDIILKDKVRIETKGKTAYGIYASGEGSQFNTGYGTMINTFGESGYGVLANSGAVVQLGGDTQITTVEKEAYGLYSYDPKSKITLGSNSKITTTGADAYGIVAAEGGDIELIGNQTIEVDLSKSEYAVYIAGAAADKSNFSADGKLMITGGIEANVFSDVNMNFRSGSVFNGFTTLEDGASKLDMKMTDSRWNLLRDSKVNTLTLTGSVIDFSNSNMGTTLTVDHLGRVGADSIFIMKADLVGGNSDKLIVAGDAEPEHSEILVANNGSAATNGTERAVMVRTAGHACDPAVFALRSGTVDVGGWQYGLEKTGNDWVLLATGKSAVATSASMNTFVGGYLLNYAETQTLLQRMGDLRGGTEKNGVWARVCGGEFEAGDGDFLGGFDMNYSGVQAGIDKKITLKDGKGDIYIGGMFGYSKGNLDYGVGNGSVDMKTLGVYGTYIAPTDFYVDTILKYGWMENDFKVIDSMGTAVRGDSINTDGLGASLEIGQRIHFDRKKKEGWYIEPQAQISYQYQSGGSFTASNGLKVDVDGFDSTLGRLGVNIGHEIKSGKNPINLYVKASYVHEFDGDIGATLNGSPAAVSFSDSWWTYGIGITAQIGQRHSVYLDLERATGGQFDQPWAINGGYRFSW